ncbi:PspA/IM30 family protein [Ammoniphilus sp. CFH 90114]|uniref:PspA/IM30 family protein n=1 Tax=Ammoniphilus sp. CFH 90114 TaxID=2493665 RepID=UPI00100FD4AB|nr:PspA/IM30 family protein [Ammoniphilus sp. CFH 90114]RXT06245.1 PspA/IM30 family protein [Ammoniphilus sp. CFH 90114]
MSILSRVRNITKATLNEMLDHVEEPIMMLNQYLRDMEREISQAELTLASQLSQEKKTKMLLEETKQRIEKRQRQAQLAIEHGQDDIARQAIYDKQLAEEKVEQYTRDYEFLVEQSQALREQLQELKEKFYTMKNKRAGLIARANAAKATKRIHDTLSPSHLESAAKGFARMEEKILNLEVDAEISEKMRRIYDPEYMPAKNNPRVETELEKMKQSALQNT